MIRCRTCGITYKDHATICLRCLTPLKETKKAINDTEKKSVNVETNPIVHKDKMVLIATATPRPSHRSSTIHSLPNKNTPQTNLFEELEAISHQKVESDISSTIGSSFEATLSAELEAISHQKTEPDIPPTNIISSQSNLSTELESALSQQTFKPELTPSKDSSSQSDITPENPPNVSQQLDSEISLAKYKLELTQLKESIKGFDPETSIGQINPLFGDIKASEVEKLYSILIDLPKVEEIYLRSQDRVSFDRGYTLENGYITHLNISNLDITHLPAHLESLEHLTVLDLEHNKLETFPDELVNLPKLEGLNLSENKLKILPRSIGKLTHLKYLWLYDNELEELPSELNQLTYLELLDLRGNKFVNRNIDPIYELKKLKFLSLESNNIKSLSDNLDYLTELETLFLGDNPIETFPDISNLKNLKELSLYGTKLNFVPESILFLPLLKSLDIWNSQIKLEDWILKELKEAGVYINTGT